MTRSCIDCTGPVTAYSKSGRCRPCANRRFNSDPAMLAKRRAGVVAFFAAKPQAFPKGRHCPCGSAIHLRSTSGLCRSCGRKAADRKPGAFEKRSAASRKGFQNLPAAELERRRAWGRHLATNVITPEQWAKSQTPEVRARAARAAVERRLGWCPAEYRDAYKQLAQSKKLGAAEARRLIEEEIAADQRRREAALTPFERQLAKVAAGGKLARAWTKPSSSPDITLGGVATGML